MTRTRTTMTNKPMGEAGLTQTPAEFAATVLGQFAVFRGDAHQAALAYARSLSSPRTLELQGTLESLVPMPTAAALNAGSSAELSDRLLAVLFGSWPPASGNVPQAPPRRLPGLSVRVASLSEWDACVSEQAGAADPASDSGCPTGRAPFCA